MIEPEIPFATPPAGPSSEDGLTAQATSEALHSWHTAGRSESGAELDWIPGTKLDWTECLPFRQVRGMEVASGPDHPFPGADASGDA